MSRLVVSAAAALVLCAAAAGSIKTGREPLPKTQFSSGPEQLRDSDVPGSVSVAPLRRQHHPATRFVFVVGLEGSGHHALASMMEACHASSGLCAPATTANLAADVGPPTSVNRSYLVHAYLMRDPEPRHGGAFATFLHQPEIRKWRDEFVDEIRNLAAPLGPSDSPKLYALNCFGKGSFYSYPFKMGELRALQHPDLPKLAELVEQGGGDLRVLVLTRDAGQLLHSTTVNRNFGDLTGESSIQATNAAVIAAQLGRIDPEFVLCVPYDRLGDVDWWHSPRMANGATSRAEWLHPAMRHSVLPNSNHSNLHAMLEAVRVHQPLPDTQWDTSGEHSDAEEREVYVEPLREMIWSLEDAAQCRP